jgi:hypothetical protein
VFDGLSLRHLPSAPPYPVRKPLDDEACFAALAMR